MFMLIIFLLIVLMINLRETNSFLAKNIRKNMKTVPEMKVVISHFSYKLSVVFIHWRKRKMIKMTVIMQQVI